MSGLEGVTMKWKILTALIIASVTFSIRLAFFMTDFERELLKVASEMKVETVKAESLEDALEMLESSEVDGILGIPYREDLNLLYVPLPIGKIDDGGIEYIFVAVEDLKVFEDLKERLRKLYEFWSVPESDRFMDPRIMKMVVINYPPYEYFDGKRWVGTDVETVREVFKRLGFILEVYSFPPERAFRLLSSGKLEGAFSLERTKERERILIYVNEPISHGCDVLFHRKDEEVSYIFGKVVGYVPGYAYVDLLRKMGVTMIPVKNDEIGIKLVSVGRLDMYLTNRLVGIHYMKKNGIENLDYTGPVRCYDSYIAFSKIGGMQLIARSVEEELKEYKKSGEYLKILERYGLSYDDIWSFVGL